MYYTLVLLAVRLVSPRGLSNCHWKGFAWVRNGVTATEILVRAGINAQAALQHAQSSSAARVSPRYDTRAGCLGPHTSWLVLQC